MDQKSIEEAEASESISGFYLGNQLKQGRARNERHSFYDTVIDAAGLSIISEKNVSP